MLKLRLIEINAVKAEADLICGPQLKELVMQEPPRIAFRNMEVPFGADDLVRDGAAELERFFDRIIACSVAVEKRHRRHHRGNLYHVCIELVVSDREIVVHRDPPEGCAHECLHIAIADAFDAALRKLQDHACEMRGAVKAYAAPTIGTIVRLFPDYGFLVTAASDEA